MIKIYDSDENGINSIEIYADKSADVYDVPSASIIKGSDLIDVPASGLKDFVMGLMQAYLELHETPIDHAMGDRWSRMAGSPNSEDDPSYSSMAYHLDRTGHDEETALSTWRATVDHGDTRLSFYSWLAFECDDWDEGGNG